MCYSHPIICFDVLFLDLHVCFGFDLICCFVLLDFISFTVLYCCMGCIVHCFVLLGVLFCCVCCVVTCVVLCCVVTCVVLCCYMCCVVL